MTEPQDPRSGEQANTGVTGDRTITGLRVFPRYLAPATPEQLARRAAHIAWVTTKHFGPTVFRRARAGDVRNVSPEDFARPLRLTFEELGTTFMKFGQLLASSPGMFGEEVAAEFRSCLDTGSAVPFDDRVR